jgi:hypothetical protein
MFGSFVFVVAVVGWLFEASWRQRGSTSRVSVVSLIMAPRPP